MSKANVLVLGGINTQKIIASTGYNIITINNNLENFAAIIIDIDLDRLEKSIEIFQEAKKALNLSSSLFFAYIDKEQDIETTKKLNRLGFSIVLYAYTPIKYIKSRLDSAIRIAIMNKQCTLRLKALERFGANFRHNFKPISKPNKVLLFADEAPITLKITNILNEYGARIIATSSSFMAFDFLHYSKFDAIVIAGNKDINKAYGFCSALRRNTKYFHIPCLIINNLRPENIEELLLRGASDFAQTDSDLDFSIANLLTLIEENHQRQELSENIKNAKTTIANDETTGLYNKEFFDHFTSLASEEQHTILRFNIIPKKDHQKTLIQTGYIISKLIRTEDCAAYMGNNIFELYLANTNHEEALIASERITSVITATCIDEISPHETIIEITAEIVPKDFGLKITKSI